MLILTALIALLPTALAAQLAGTPEGRAVLSTRQQPEDAAEPMLDAATFNDLVTQKTGEPYSSENIRESIERLYGTGRFADIRVDAEEQGAGVAVRFLTSARYFTGTVRVTGAPPPPTASELESAAGLELGAPYSEQDLGAVTERLRHVLEDDGYYQAEVDHRADRHPASQQVDLYFEVRAGERARLGEVHITGGAAIPTRKLLDEADWEPGKSYKSSLVQNGLMRLRNLYRKENYLEAIVTISGHQFHRDTNRVDL
jgi:outer membrane protein insertion porin family